MSHKRLLFLAIIPFLSLPSCSKSTSFIERTFSLSNDNWDIKLYDGATTDLDTLQSKMTRAYEISDSFAFSGTNNVFAINTAKNQAIAIDDDLKSLLTGAISRSSLTLGYFDPLIGELVSLWDLALTNKKVPTNEEIASALENKKNTVLSISSSSVTLSGDGLLDLGAIRKGYALSLCLTYLKSKGIKNYIVDAGGFDRLYGENPDDGNGKFNVTLSAFGGKKVSLKNSSILTYSNYEDEVVVDGVAYSSIINPKTGKNEFVSPVAVAIGDDSMSLDAISMVSSLLGEKGAKKFESTTYGSSISIILGDKDKVSYSSSSLAIS